MVLPAEEYPAPESIEDQLNSEQDQGGGHSWHPQSLFQVKKAATAMRI